VLELLAAAAPDLELVPGQRFDFPANVSFRGPEQLWLRRGATSSRATKSLRRTPHDREAVPSSADLATKEQTLEVLRRRRLRADRGEATPTFGAIEGEDFLVCFEALATPVAARDWLAVLRQHTDKPVPLPGAEPLPRGAGARRVAFDAEVIVAHENTRALVAERGKEDWASEFARCRGWPKPPTRCPG